MSFHYKKLTLVIAIAICLLVVFPTSISAQYVPGPWPEKEPKFESAFCMRAGLTVSNIDESLKLYRDILGMKVIVDRKKMYDPRLPDFAGINPGQTIRLVILAPKTSGDEMLNAGYIAMSEVCDSNGVRITPKKNVITSGAEPGSIMLQFLVDDVRPIHEKIAALNYEIISEPKEQPDGKRSELLVRDPNGIRLWITDRYNRAVFLHKKKG